MTLNAQKTLEVPSNQMMETQRQETISDSDGNAQGIEEKSKTGTPSAPRERTDEDKEATENDHAYTYSPADEILKYKNLLDLGAISQEEFEQKKKQLLGL